MTPKLDERTREIIKLARETLNQRERFRLIDTASQRELNDAWRAVAVDVLDALEDADTGDQRFWKRDTLEAMSDEGLESLLELINFDLVP